MIQNLTLSALKTAKIKNGTSLISVTTENDLNQLVQYAQGKSKSCLPVLYCYQGIKGEYTPSNCCFVDIDTKVGVDVVLSNSEEVFTKIPYIAFMQKSASGKLHICCMFPSKAETPTKFLQLSTLYTVATVELIKKLLGIDYFVLKDDKGNKAIDMHNTKFEQALYISCNTIIYNCNCTPISFDGQVVLKLKQEHPNSFISQEEVTNHFVEISNTEYVSGDYNTGKIKIDASFFVGTYGGNHLRWRISRIAEALFGDNAKAWCDRYFYRDEGSIYTKQNSQTINTTVLHWLEENHFIKKVIPQGVIKIDKDKWLSDYATTIYDFVDKNRVSYIVAPTGVGKTTFINDHLAQKYNAVVLVPFNVTNQLYNKLVEVSSSTDNGISAKSMVMIWDQFLKYKELLKNRTVIIDEAHCLFKDRTYRDSAVQLFKFLQSIEFNGKIILISATPEGEANILKANELRFDTHRSIINTYWVETKNPLLREYYCVVNALEYNKYDRIVLFDNRYSKKIRERLIAERLISKEDIAYLKADRKDTTDFVNVRNTELLDKKLTICTCVAFNGLNFKNENEKILVVTSVQNGEDTYSSIVQELGRVRNSNVVGYIYYDPELTDKISIEAKAQIVKELTDLAEKENFDDRLLSYNRDLADLDVASARIEIEKYNYLNANKLAILCNLQKYNYINIKVKDLEDEKYPGFRLAIKKQESDEMINDIMQDKWEDKNYTGEYNTEWAKELKYLLEKNSSWLNEKIIKSLLKSKHKNKLVETAIDNVKEIIRICNLTEEQWNSYLNADAEIISIIHQNIQMLRDYIAHRKHQIAIRDKWAPVVQQYNGVSELFLPVIFEELIAEQEAQHMSIIDANTNAGKIGGKIGSPKKKVKDLETGIIYESVSDYAAAYNKSVSWASKYKDKWEKV